VPVASHEADIILDVLEKCSPKCGNLDVFQRDKLASQCLVYALQASFIVEDVAKERVFVGAFGFHHVLPSMVIIP